MIKRLNIYLDRTKIDSTTQYAKALDIEKQENKAEMGK